MWVCMYSMYAHILRKRTPLQNLMHRLLLKILFWYEVKIMSNKCKHIHKCYPVANINSRSQTEVTKAWLVAGGFSSGWRNTAKEFKALWSGNLYHQASSLNKLSLAAVTQESEMAPQYYVLLVLLLHKSFQPRQRVWVIYKKDENILLLPG